MLRYEYKCPKCDLELEFHKRVTMTKRRCPHCGELITPHEIDRQENERRQETLRFELFLGRLLLGGLFLGLGLGLIGLVVSVVSNAIFPKQDQSNSSEAKADNVATPPRRNIPQVRANDPKPDKFVPKGGNDVGRKNPPKSFDDDVIKSRPIKELDEERKVKKDNADQEIDRQKGAKELEAKTAFDNAKATVQDAKKLAEQMLAIADKYPDTQAGKEADRHFRQWLEEKEMTEKTQKLAMISKQLESPKVADKIAGLEAAKKLEGDAESLTQKICELVFDANTNVSFQASVTLKAVAPKLHGPVLSLRSERISFATTPQVMESLAAMGTSAKPAASVVVLTLSKLNPMGIGGEGRIPGSAFRCLRAMSDTSNAHLELAKRFSGCSEWTDRKEAVESIAFVTAAKDARTAAASVKILTMALQDQNYQVKIAAVNGLGSLGKSALNALPNLKRLAIDPNKQVREAATAAIEMIEN